MHVHFVLLANGTSLHIISHKDSHSWPPIVQVDTFKNMQDLVMYVMGQSEATVSDCDLLGGSLHLSKLR